MLINTERIEEILVDCLIKESDNVNGECLPYNEFTVVDGIVNKYAFHKNRLESYRDEVQNMVNNLCPELKEGISFLNMCMDKDNNQWGEHRDCENLLCLAIGLDILAYPLPKEVWAFLPGAMPFIVLRNK